MSLRAGKLIKNDAQKNEIKRILNHIMTKIDEDIKIAHDSGKKELTVLVPITFSIPNMKNSDVQRDIYYSILNSLISRDFHPKIEMKKKFTAIHIKWLSDEELRNIKIQNDLLAKLTIG